MVQYEKEYRIIEFANRKGLMGDGKLILPPEFVWMNVHVPGDEQGTTSLLPYVVVIAKDLNWEYYIFCFKPRYDGVETVYAWKAPTTTLHTPWKLVGHHIFNDEYGTYNLDGTPFFNTGR